MLPTADINVTSLVDVAFVLLIIFMITAPMMQGGVPVELPKAEGRPLAPREGIIVTVDRRGQIRITEDFIVHTFSPVQNSNFTSPSLSPISIKIRCSSERFLATKVTLNRK